MKPTRQQVKSHQAASTLPVWTGGPLGTSLDQPTTGPNRQGRPPRSEPYRRRTDTVPLPQVFTGAAGRAGPSMPAGCVVDFAGGIAPAGWLKCNGTLLVKTEYPALYAAIGDAYNSGCEEPGEFRLPMLCGRVSVGCGLDALQTYWPLAQAGGETEVFLLSQHLPELETGEVQGGSGANPVLNFSAGHGTALSNMPPYLTVLKIIKT